MKAIHRSRCAPFSRVCWEGRAPSLSPPRRREPAPPIKRKPRPLPPPKRRLRIYALDPSVAKRLDSVSVFQATLSVPWDDRPSTAYGLLPGPVGEYLEVVDVDPASNRVYDPVDLNDKILLAQDGWAPSEGNPQFHQQMVYAVAMTTIGHFEQALGRRRCGRRTMRADYRTQRRNGDEGV